MMGDKVVFVLEFKGVEESKGVDGDGDGDSEDNVDGDDNVEGIGEDNVDGDGEDNVDECEEETECKLDKGKNGVFGDRKAGIEEDDKRKGKGE